MAVHESAYIHGGRTIDLSSKRVVVTGATGFLGGHVLKCLHSANATVVGVVDRARGSRHSAATRSVETLYFDHPDQIVPLVRSAQPDYVIHLHAVVTTERTAAAVQRTLEINLLPSLNLMVACGEMQVKRLILMGSGEEFGPAKLRSRATRRCSFAHSVCLSSSCAHPSSMGRARLRGC
jgi:nucleoside-diphosphate-sugar epimerase